MTGQQSPANFDSGNHIDCGSTRVHTFETIQKQMNGLFRAAAAGTPCTHDNCTTYYYRHTYAPGERTTASPLVSFYGLPRARGTRQAGPGVVGARDTRHARDGIGDVHCRGRRDSSISRTDQATFTYTFSEVGIVFDRQGMFFQRDRRKSSEIQLSPSFLQFGFGLYSPKNSIQIRITQSIPVNHSRILF